MATAKTNRKYFNQLCKLPLFFLKRVVRHYDEKDRNGQKIEVEHHYWHSMDEYVSFDTEVSSVENNNLDYLLVCVYREEVQYDSKGKIVDNPEIVEFSIKACSPSARDHLIYIFNTIFNKIPNDNFWFKYLIWFLNFRDWSVQSLKNTIDEYNNNARVAIFNTLSKISVCFSETKQQQIKLLLDSFGINYDIKMPSLFLEAWNSVEINNNTKIKEIKDCNWFDIIDNVFSSKINSCPEYSNLLIAIKSWLDGEDFIFDYSELAKVYSLVDSSLQGQFIKRYFYDIQTNKTSLSIDIIKQFRDNTYSDFIRYRHCLNNPEERVFLGNALLADCIITLNQTNGNAFLSFDGILDFAIRRSELNNPKIDLGLSSFIPSCNGGAVYDDNFCGYIDYACVYQLAEDKLTKENLDNTIISLLSNIFRKKDYTCCAISQDLLSEETLKHCNCIYKQKTEFINPYTGARQETINHIRCGNISKAYYKDVWTGSEEHACKLNTFLIKKLPVPSQYDKANKDIDVRLEETSSEVLRESIMNLYKSKQDTLGNIILKRSSLNNFEWLMLKEYIIPVKMRIYPNKNTIVGTNFDVFGFAQDIPNNLPDKAKKIELIRRERDEVFSRVNNKLKEMLGTAIVDDNYYEVAYDAELLGKITNLFYYKHSISQNQDNKTIEISDYEKREPSWNFLKAKSYEKFKPFCAPKLANSKNAAIALPFFWCRGRECFKNQLGYQTTEECNNWHNYSLFHLVEIMGYPKLHMTEAGYEPDKIVVDFIAVANRVTKLIKQLVCRECNHLLLTSQNDAFNRRYYYSCINPTCTAYEKPNYLNFCYKCKKGLIDSRDTKWCPNGWYICPTCHSCCEDQLFERIKQKYILDKRPIPYSIKALIGHGHNDKHFYYCHECGGELTIVSEHRQDSLLCAHCRKVYRMTLFRGV